VVSLLEFHHGDVLAETHQRIEKVNFSHSGIISCVVELVGGGAIETGMITNDGEFGASQRPKNCVAPKCRNRWAVSGSTAGLPYVSLTRQIVVWPTHCGLGGFAMTTGALGALILCVEVFLLSFAAMKQGCGANRCVAPAFPLCRCGESSAGRLLHWRVFQK
jgi:hypothetical protein